MLHFKAREEWFSVRDDGSLKQMNRKDDFTGEWKFLGVSFHHWRQEIDLYFHPNVEAAKFIKGYIWDLDHETVRTWGGGGEIRITQAYKD